VIYYFKTCQGSNCSIVRKFAASAKVFISSGEISLFQFDGVTW